MQRAHHTSAQDAYDTFCDELENCLPYVFGLHQKLFRSWRRMPTDARQAPAQHHPLGCEQDLSGLLLSPTLRQEQALWPDILPDLA